MHTSPQHTQQKEAGIDDLCQLLTLPPMIRSVDMRPRAGLDQLDQL